jgi:hypothetical protein
MTAPHADPRPVAPPQPLPMTPVVLAEAEVVRQCIRALQGIPGDLFQVVAPAEVKRLPSVFKVAEAGVGVAWAVPGLSRTALRSILERTADVASTMCALAHFHELCFSGGYPRCREGS